MSEDSGESPEVPAGSDGSTAVAVMDRPGELELARAEEQQRVELRKDRVWLPFLIPVGAILAVVLTAFVIWLFTFESTAITTLPEATRDVFVPLATPLP